MSLLTILAWILLGLLAGWVASLFMGTNDSQGMLMDIVIGILGAFIGGFLATLLGLPGVEGFSIYSLIIATLGAVVLIWLRRVFT